MFSENFTWSFLASDEEETNLFPCEDNGSSFDGKISPAFGDVEVLINCASFLDPFWIDPDGFGHSDQLFAAVCEHMTHYHPAIWKESTIDVDCHSILTKVKRQLLFVCLFFFYF